LPEPAAHTDRHRRAERVELVDNGLWRRDVLLEMHPQCCVATALVLHSRILDLIEAADYDVFTKRQRVPVWEKLLVALRTVIAGPARTDFGQLSPSIASGGSRTS